MGNPSTIGAGRQPIRIKNTEVTASARGVKFPLHRLHEFTNPPIGDNGQLDTPCDIAPVYIPQTDGYVDIWDGAGLLKASRPPRHSLKVGGASSKDVKSALIKPTKTRGVRGRISNFSRSSRWRLMQAIGKMRIDQIPLFVTLTYPAEFSLDPKDWKRDLATFYKRLRRRFPHSSALWKLEPQKRGAPHYHMFIWGVDELQLRIWIAQAWYEVVDSGDKKHYHHGCKVEHIRSWAGVRSYAAKYMGKEQTGQPGWEFPGRWWGIFNADKLPVGQLVRLGLPRAESILILRNMRKYAKMDKRRKKGRFKGDNDYPSLTILCNNASGWLGQIQAYYRCWPIPVQPKKRGKYARTHKTTS